MGKVIPFHPRPPLLGVAFLGLLFALPAGATDLEIQAAEIAGANWSLRNVRVTAKPAGPGFSVQMDTGRLQLSRQRVWTGASLHCTRLDSRAGWSCTSGRLALQGSPWGPLGGQFSAAVLQIGGNASAWLRMQGQGPGWLNLNWRSVAGRWTAQAQGDLQVAPLLAGAGFLPKGWQAQGQGALTARAAGARWAQADHVALHLQGRGLGFSNAAGLRAAQDVQLEMAAAGSRGKTWSGTAQLRWRKGAVLWSPWYWSAPAAQPVSSRLRWQLGARDLRLTAWQIIWPGLGTASATARIPRGGGAARWTVEHADLAAGPFYATWVKPLAAAGGLAAGLQAQGSLHFSLDWQGGLQAISWQLGGAGLQDAKKRIAIQGLASQGRWAAQGPAAQASLAWHAAELYRLPVGPVDGRFLLAGKGFSLLHPVQIALLGGSLRVQQLDGSWSGPQAGFRLAGALQNANLTALATAFHWPPFTGRVAAVIPELRYAQGNLETSGVLSAQAFGGNVLVQDLRIRNLLGAFPILTADVRMRGLQLKPLTEAFHFGFISGVLDGDVHDLRLLNWRPDAFSARFYTVRSPGVAQQISQAAVQNLTRLGGGNGLSGFFQTLFLRMFKTFRYAHLGLGVILHNNVAELSGVGREDKGFVILQGEGLPRVDVVGYNPRVGWSELLARLATAMHSGAQVKTGE